MDEKLWEDLYEKILEGDILEVLSFVLEYRTRTLPSYLASQDSRP